MSFKVRNRKWMNRMMIYRLLRYLMISELSKFVKQKINLENFIFYEAVRVK